MRTTRFPQASVNITCKLVDDRNLYEGLVFWNILEYNFLKVNQRFGGTCRLHLQGWRLNQARNQECRQRVGVRWRWRISGLSWRRSPFIGVYGIAFQTDRTNHSVSCENLKSHSREHVFMLSIESGTLTEPLCTVLRSGRLRGYSILCLRSNLPATAWKTEARGHKTVWFNSQE
jgi:hypothetical protein